jgi:hypothetical protein
VSMNGYTIDEVKAGHIFDIASIVEDPESKFFPPLSELPVCFLFPKLASS